MGERVERSGLQSLEGGSAPVAGGGAGALGFVPSPHLKAWQPCAS